MDEDSKHDYEKDINYKCSVFIHANSYCPIIMRKNLEVVSHEFKCKNCYLDGGKR